MEPLDDALAAWRNVYELLGTASATLVGLLFVAASVASGAFSTNSMAPMRMFLGASVVHFSGILTACLLLLAPIRSQVLLGSLIVVCGLFGLGYYAVTVRDVVRDGLIKRIDLEDRTWYGFLPVASYLLETAAGIALICGVALGWPALALTLVLLLLIGIHNAWDITVWSISRTAARQANMQQDPPAQQSGQTTDGN